MKKSSIILILLAIGLLYTFTRSEWERVKSLSRESSEYKNVLANIERIAEIRDKLLVNYEAIPTAEIDRLSKVLPDNIDSVRLALDLDTIASRYGTTLKNVKVKMGGADNSTLPVLPQYSLPYEKVTVSFSFISNHGNFMKILSDLEKSLRIMDIKSVAFEAEDTGLYEHNLMVETYWLKGS